MPVYVYACSNCGHQFEERQSFSDDALTVCPECGQTSLRKVFNSVGIVFKGSGFYRTDSRSGSSSTVSSGSDSGSKSASSDSKSADSKPASSGDSSSTTSAGSAASTSKATPST